MKLIHLSDLHLGKRVHEFSMLEDQAYILEEILRIVDEEQPDGVVIAGDVYDRPVPSAEAVNLCDDFLWKLAARGCAVLMISGNHDSADRLAFGGRLMEGSGVYLAPVYRGVTEPVTLQDDFGPVRIYLLPFVKPAQVRACFPEEEISSYTDAVRASVSHMELVPGERNVLVTHQFVAGAERSDSEELSVGGTDSVDVGVFAPFDYVALGHIHRPQNMKGGRVRYCGTPLKYSFSEAAHEKSVTVVELGEKKEGQDVCELQIRTIPLIPKRDMREIRGTYEEVTLRQFYEGTSLGEDYLHVILTDEEDIPDGAAKLRTVYHNLMKLSYDNRRTRGNADVSQGPAVEEQTPMELFAAFYEQQNNQELSEEQRTFLSGLIERVWEDEQ